MGLKLRMALRNVVVVWDESIDIDAFFWLERELSVKIHFATSVAQMNEIASKVHLSILLLCFAKDVDVNEYLTNCPGASAMLIMPDNSYQWSISQLNFNVDDEMIFDGTLPSRTLLKHKVQRLQNNRWGKKAHTIFSGLLTGYPFPFIITRSINDDVPRLIYCNEQFRKNFESENPNEDLLNLDLLDHYAVDLNRDRKQDGLGFFVDGVIHHKSDESRNFGVHVLPISDPKNANIKYQVAFEFEKSIGKSAVSLENDLDRLREQGEAQEKFMANVVHDIRRPLNNIISLIEILSDQELSEDMQSVSTAIWSSGKSLNKLVEDLLSLTKITSGQFEIVNGFFDIEKFVRSVQVMFEKEMALKDLEFKVEIDPEVPKHMEGDESRLSQIMVNFLGNAIKFTDKGSVEFQVKLKRRTKKQVVVCFSVTDTGIGVKPEHQQEIFKSFTQADSSIQRYYGGTGLGLSICKELTRLMSGKIYMTSQFGKGSTFSVEIPLGIHAQPEPKESTEKPELNGLSVLLVDDNDVITVVLQRLIARWGCVPYVASSFDEALTQFDRLPTDLVITDIQLDGADGVDLAKALKEKAGENDTYLPVIGISSHPNPSTQMSGKWLDHFMLKPINSEELFEKISFLITDQNRSFPKDQSGYMNYEIIDSEKIRSFASSDEEFMKQLIEIFLKRTPEYMDELNRAVEKQDWTMIKMMAHKVKPTFTYVGMDEFTHKVGSIEDFAIKEDMASIRRIMHEVWEDCQRAFREFEDLASKLN